MPIIVLQITTMFRKNNCANNFALLIRILKKIIMPIIPHNAANTTWSEIIMLITGNNIKTS